MYVHVGAKIIDAHGISQEGQKVVKCVTVVETFSGTR